MADKKFDYEKVRNMFEANGVAGPSNAARAIATRVRAGDITPAQGMTLARKKVREAKGEKPMSQDEYKMKTDLRNQKTFGEGRILDKKKSGGSIKSKKSKAQAIRDAEGTGMALDAHMVDKEEGRLVKDSKGRDTTEFNPKTRKKRRGKTQAKMGGGKVHSSKYTSGNKRYANGGKIYPMVGK